MNESEQNVKLMIFKNLIFKNRCNLRLINNNFNDIFKKYKHDKYVRTTYNKKIDYCEYKLILKKNIIMY